MWYPPKKWQRALSHAADDIAAAEAAVDEARASRIAATPEYAAEAAANEAVALTRVLSALAAEAAETAPDADTGMAGPGAIETLERASRVSDLVAPRLEPVDDSRAYLIANALAAVVEIAVDTGHHADRNNGPIRSAAEAAHVVASLLVSNAKTRIDDQDDDPPSQLVEVVGAISAELIARLKTDSRGVYGLGPRQFEELVAEILASFGWDVHLTPTTRDGGYDIFAISKDTAAGVRTSWLIECKRNAPERKIGVDIVRALYGLKLDLRVANAILATTSYFSGDARQYKQSRYDLELKDYEGIVEWVNAYRPSPNGQLYVRDNHLIRPESAEAITLSGGDERYEVAVPRGDRFRCAS